MGFITNLLKGNDSNTAGPKSGGAAEEQGPGSGNAGYRDDGSNPYLDKQEERSPWNKILGMSGAGGSAKSMLSTPTGNEQLNPRAMAGAAGGAARPEPVNPKAAAWDRYTSAYSPKGGAAGGAPDPGDMQMFDMIWD